MLLGGTEAICCVVVMFCYRTAWKQLEDMSAEQAMQEYVSCVTSLDPDSSQKVKSPHKSKYHTTFDLTNVHNTISTCRKLCNVGTETNVFLMFEPF